MSNKLLPFVSIVIPVFNEERYLAECLTSLEALNYPKDRFEILLVDNGSTDRTLEIARQFPDVNIYVKEKVKVGAVRNYGARNAKGSVIAFLDSDCVVSDDWLGKGVRNLSTLKHGVLGGQYLLRERPSWLEKHWILTNSDRAVSQTTLVGGCIFIPKEIFFHVGGFDEFLNAGEDSDLTERLKKEKFIVKIDPSLSVVHLGFPTQVRPFVKRQLWHASDYINGLPGSLNDKIFLLTLVFIGGLTGVFASLIFSSLGLLSLIISISLVVSAPAVLSVKRIVRSGARYRNIKDYLSIYVVDWLYLIGRALGVLSGVRNLIALSPDAKIERR